ncbi:hypothetical protein [uncultured Methylobacterium sp.]|uniref:hypothetical protein n=1 Tax=uncultured Methylobacterium sp. TaxID=157278 RepID=UPI00261A7BB5|nr:hypothetical protein [uncultured Methylobacterium sp.]
MGAVFGNWRQDPELMARFNPLVELNAAREIRDRVLAHLLVKPGQLVRLPDEPRARQRAQVALVDITRLLAGERRWGRLLINRYLGIEMPDEVWAMVMTEAMI